MSSSPTSSAAPLDLLTNAPLSAHASDSPFYSLPQSTTTVGDEAKPVSGDATSDPNTAPSSLDSSTSSALANHAAIDESMATGFDFSSLRSSVSSSSSSSSSSNLLDTSLDPVSSSHPHASELAVITATSNAFLSTAHGGLHSARPATTLDTDDVAFPPSSTSTPTSPHREPALQTKSGANSRTNSRQGSGSKLTSASPIMTSTPAAPGGPSIPAAASAPSTVSRLAASNSTDNLFANPQPEASPTPVVGAASVSGGRSAGAAPASRGIFNRLFNPFGGGANQQPNPSPSASPQPGNSAVIPPISVGQASPNTPFLQTTTPAAVSVVANSTSGSPATTPPSSLPTNPTPIPVVIPKSYSYQDFAAKMKLPGAQDLVKQLKGYVKLVQSQEWMSKHAVGASGSEAPAQGNGAMEKSVTPTGKNNQQQTEFDKIKQEYNELITSIMKTIRYKHPLWKGCSEEEIDNSLESIEKFLTSKLYDRFFGLFPSDRIKDNALTERLFILNTWVKPAHFDLPSYCCQDLNVWEHPSQELCAMDRFKSPRDKLVCLLNCCHIINNILKKAKVKANQEKLKEKQERMERERESLAAATATATATALAVTENGTTTGDEPVLSTAIDPPTDPAQQPKTSPSNTVAAVVDDSFTPSSSPSADDFFPALIYTLIHARPPHLYLNLTYISLCRYDMKLTGGEAAYWYTNLASAIAFLETVSEKSFSFGKEALRNPEKAKKEYEELMERGKEMWERKVQQEKQEEEKERKRREEEELQQQEKKRKSMEGEPAPAANGEAPPDASTAPSTTTATSVDVSTSSISVASSVSPSSSSSSAPHLLHNHGSSSWTVSSSSGSSGSVNIAPVPLPPPCLACLQLSHRRVPTHFLDREFSSLTIAELQDVLREYKELCFVLQGWQEAPMHREMKSMPLPTKMARGAEHEDADGVALLGSDANSAAPTNAAVAASSVASNQSTAAPTTAATSRGWPLTNFLGLGRGGK